MSCPKQHIVFDRKAYSDKNEEILIELCPAKGEVLSIPQDEYTVKLGELTLLSSVVIEDGVITIAAVIPANTLDTGIYKTGLIYPNTANGAEYFEITFTIELSESSS